MGENLFNFKIVLDKDAAGKPFTPEEAERLSIFVVDILSRSAPFLPGFLAIKKEVLTERLGRYLNQPVSQSLAAIISRDMETFGIAMLLDAQRHILLRIQFSHMSVLN